MKKRPKFFLAELLLPAALLAGCTRHVQGGDPALPLSNSNGTARIFPAAESTVLTAISNGFATDDANPMGYRGMDLSPSAEPFLGPNWHVTNGFVLFPLSGPITNVPLRGHTNVLAPYTACFNIITRPVDSSHTEVLVRTIFAKVRDGKEIGVHGGWANHERDVPPVKAEEENVLTTISNAMLVPHASERPIP